MLMVLGALKRTLRRIAERSVVGDRSDGASYGAGSAAMDSTSVAGDSLLAVGVVAAALLLLRRLTRRR